MIFPQINGEGRGGKPIAFRSTLTELVDECRPLGGLTAFTRMQVDGRLPTPVQKLYARALRTIGAAIVRGPVQFAGNARGAPEFSFQPGTNRGGRILVRGDVWREFALMRHWIRDAVVLRWSEMTARLSEGGVQPGAVINLLLQDAEPFRQDPTIREFYMAHRDQLRCAWTDKRLGAGLDVDHAIPFAFWQASPAWNLLPASPSVNNAKRDKLPTGTLVRRREEAIVGCWRLVSREFPQRFVRDAVGLLGADPGADWERPLLAGLVEAIEYTATMRGAERWEP